MAVYCFGKRADENVKPQWVAPQVNPNKGPNLGHGVLQFPTGSDLCLSGSDPGLGPLKPWDSLSPDQKRLHAEF